MTDSRFQGGHPFFSMKTVSAGGQHASLQVQRHGSVLRGDVTKVVEAVVDVIDGLTAVDDTTGEITVNDLDAGAKAMLEQFRADLPTDLEAMYSQHSLEEFARELRQVCNTVRVTRVSHKNADLAYDEWQRVHGFVEVPLEDAHAFFVDGVALVSPEERKADERYRNPNRVKIRFEGDDEEDYNEDETIPVLTRDGDGSMDGEKFRKVAEEDFEGEEAKEAKKAASKSASLAHFTNRPQFYELLLTLERNFDFLEQFEWPEDPATAKALRELAEASARSKESVSWLRIEDMGQLAGGIELSINEYRSLVNILNATWSHPISALVRDSLQPYLRDTRTRADEKQKSSVKPAGWVRTVGRRKNASAAVWLMPGTGAITVNGGALDEYFSRVTDRAEVVRPLELVGVLGQYDVRCETRGGGISGQAGACRHGIARALFELDPGTRPVLKKNKMLRRDPRMVERKKPGQKKARKKFQWVKR